MSQIGDGQKAAYICGPLTELAPSLQARAKKFYERAADVCLQCLGKRAFVPHEHYDPIRHAKFSPAQVDEAERRQVCEMTSALIVFAIAPSWGGGIEVEMANRSGVPVIVFYEKGKRISRLLMGNPAVIRVFPCSDEAETFSLLRSSLLEFAAKEVIV